MTLTNYPIYCLFPYVHSPFLLPIEASYLSYIFFVTLGIKASNFSHLLCTSVNSHMHTNKFGVFFSHVILLYVSLITSPHIEISELKGKVFSPQKHQRENLRFKKDKNLYTSHIRNHLQVRRIEWKSNGNRKISTRK